MCLYLLMIIILVINNNNYVASYSEPLKISANSKEVQTLTLDEGETPTILRVYDIETDLKDGVCKGLCLVNRTRKKYFSGCNIIETNGVRHINILMRKPVTKKFNGDWQCTIAGDHVNGSIRVKQNVKFTIIVNELNNTGSPLPTLPITEFIINLEELRPDQLTTLRYSNLSVVEGDQAVMMIITGLNYYLPGNCTAVCDINRIANISDSSCNVVNASIGQRNQINMLLDSFTVTESHNGPWDCNFDLPPKQPATERQKLKLPLSVTVTQKESSNDSKLVYYLSAAGVLVVLIIIGQTICILYFKSKARKAGIAKNLTPKNSTHENATEMRERYVTKSTGPPEVRDSLYEALDTVGGLAPPPPPLSTLPVTPKLTMARSVLQKNLSAKPDGFKTTPHPLPKNPQNQQKQRKFNTLDRCSSLERIRNRPPLPIPAEIYEVMVTEESPVIQKTSRFESNNTQERTPLIKKPYIGKHKSSPSDGATGRVPNSPALGRKPGAGFPSKPAPEQLPVPSGRPFGPSVLQKPPTGAKPGMRALPVLPSMITAANLKPVKQFGGPPASANPKISPKLDSLKKPATNPRPLPSRLQPPLPIAPEANTITRSKPPMPLPALITPEPELIPTEDPECYDSSSDDEFKCYDDLAEYRIYGNTQPKKFK